jgi:hypothetical protein
MPAGLVNEALLDCSHDGQPVEPEVARLISDAHEAAAGYRKNIARPPRTTQAAREQVRWADQRSMRVGRDLAAGHVYGEVAP